MASNNSRTCERCGAKASPHIPRVRARDGRMVCQGCQNSLSRELDRTAAKKKAGGTGAKRKAQPPAGDFGWENDLAPEGHHPLASPLPASVWEKYAKRREMLGLGLLSPSHAADAEAKGADLPGDSEPLGVAEESPRQTRLRLWRRKKSLLQSTAGAAPGAESVPHPDGMPAEMLAQHLVDHHGSDEHAAMQMAKQFGHGEVAKFHSGLHDQTKYFDDDNHVHAKQTMPEPSSHAGLEEHLQKHHNLADWELGVMGPDGLKDAHDQFHHSTSFSGSDAPNHHHIEAGPEEESGGGEGGLTLPKNHNNTELYKHLEEHHNIPPAQANAIKNVLPSDVKNMHEWHDQQHGPNAMKGGPEMVPHNHGADASGSEVLKHPSKFTSSALHSHLLEDHGIDPDHMENAINGAFEGTHPSHITGMLHDKMHSEGQIKNSHTHNGWSGPTPIHEGHTDVAKPFWGAPPDNVQKSWEHLTGKKGAGGHGIDNSVLQNMAGVEPHWSDAEAQAAYEKVHGDLHGGNSSEIAHQHVPTTQPGVKTPQQIKKEKLLQHLKDYHGKTEPKLILNPEFEHGNYHDLDAFDNNGHPGHEHPAWDKHGPVIQTLPSSSGDGGTVPQMKAQHEHASAMGKGALLGHMYGHDSESSDPIGDSEAHLKMSHEELLQKHALEHVSGKTDGHEHNPSGAMATGLEANDPFHGHEPEIQTETHAHIGTSSDALTHILKHHPNVSLEQYQQWGKKYPGGKKPTPVAFHDALHTPGSKDVMGNTLPKVLDGHDHDQPVGPPATIAIGHHLVHQHGMSQDKVAAMSPAEFKAHHEKQHMLKDEMDIGHGHDYPGGPQRDPRTHAINPHHEMFRDDTKHPAVHEWYHGTATDYDGPPKNATELQDGHGFWGNWGGGDWNNHAGTHWTSLHSMAANFSTGSGSASRVIHAKLHMKNPIVYNSLNHMSHDAYDRLRASGHMQDGGEYDDNHDDDSGYNHCCSDNLLAYAKGHHRSDGKFGMEAYRDSLRASGHDGILVRNQADSPEGHWNAVPLSADSIEITHGGCRGTHDDERDRDTQEFRDNLSKVNAGWVHPKRFVKNEYAGKMGRLPDGDEVTAAHEAKKIKPPPFKDAEGRGDHDPYLNGREFDAGVEEQDNKWCEHCDEHTDHESDDCENKWCDVCDGHGNHTKDDGTHPHCEHCDDYADHESDDHEDEWGEKPDEIRHEGYCPSCDTSTKENYNESDCVSCGEKLPDWGKLAAHGKPVKPHEYKADGDASNAEYGDAEEASHDPGKNGEDLAAHLYHHHKSDVGGKEFDKDGEWDEDALGYHHQWLHQNAKEAESKGFTVDHTHKDEFGHFPEAKGMSGAEMKAHLLLSHTSHQHAGAYPSNLSAIMSMSDEDAHMMHAQHHAADDAVKWGEKDDHSGELKKKITHTHGPMPQQLSFEPFSPEYPKSVGKGLVDHIQDNSKHLGNLSGSVSNYLTKNPEVAEALHKQLHENFGNASEPHLKKAHFHDEAENAKLSQFQQVKNHMIQDHGADPDHYEFHGASLGSLMKLHHKEHVTNHPSFNKPDHTHFGGTAHSDPEGHTKATMKKPEPEGPKKVHISVDPVTTNKWGDGSVLSHIQDDHHEHPELQELAHKVMDIAGDHGPNAPETGKALVELQKAHSHLHDPEEGSQHPKHYHYKNENQNAEPESKTSARRWTLSDLFEEVAS